MDAVRLESIGDNLTVRVTAGKHTFLMDDPKDSGTDDGPTTYQMLLSALGACTTMTLLLYARRQKWPLEGVSVELSDERKIPTQAGEAPTETIHMFVTLKGPLTQEQKDRLTQIAERCPVHRTLMHPPTMVLEVESAA